MSTIRNTFTVILRYAVLGLAYIIPIALFAYGGNAIGYDWDIYTQVLSTIFGG